MSTHPTATPTGSLSPTASSASTAAGSGRPADKGHVRLIIIIVVVVVGFLVLGCLSYYGYRRYKRRNTSRQDLQTTAFPVDSTPMFASENNRETNYKNNRNNVNINDNNDEELQQRRKDHDSWQQSGTIARRPMRKDDEEVDFSDIPMVIPFT